MAGKESQNGNSREKDIHIVIAAKGGIGKTYVASLLAQYAATIGTPMRVRDLDQSNAMLARIPSLKAESVNLLTDARFDATLFDGLVREIVTVPGPYLLDVGASTFQDVWRYTVKYRLVELLAMQNRRVVIHSVIVGGPELPDTIESFTQMSDAVPGKQIVVWLNPIRGPVAMGGKAFEDMAVLQQHSGKVVGIVALPSVDEVTLHDLQQLALHRGTLTTLENAKGIDFISRHRLSAHRDELFAQLAPMWSDLDAAAK